MKRFLFLAYGVITYAIFFATFCYALGFVTELIVPKHISSPALFPVKFVPVEIERSTFVLITCILLIGMFILWQPIGGAIWNVESPTLSAIITTVAMIGAGIVLVSTFLINHFDLFGLRQVWMQFRGQTYTHLKFQTKGFYKYMRHPLMFGFLVLFWATPNMTLGHLIFALLTTGYIFVALIFEERDLVKYHGAKYEQYKRDVPKVIPFTKGRAKGISAPVRQPQW